MQKPVAPAESMKHLALPRGFEARLFAAEPDIVKPICMAWDHRGRLWIAETTDYPNDKRRRGRGERPDQDLRGHRRRRQGRQVHRLRRGPEHPDEPGLRRRRRRRPPGARHALPEGHRRRRQGRRPQGPLHRLGHGRHPRRPEQPALRVRQLALRDRRLLRVPGGGRRRATSRSARASIGSGPTGRSSSSSGARTTTPGASASARKGSCSARRPTTARASSCRSPTATTSRSAGGRRGCWRTSPTPTASSPPRTRSARSTGTAGSPRRPAMPLYTARAYPRHYWNRTAFVASRPGTWSPRSRSSRGGATSPRTTAGTCSPATTNGPRPSRPRSAPTATSG